MMNDLVRKTILTGLGLVETGTKAAEKLGRELAQQAELSEKEGQKLAKRLRERSEKAIVSLRKTVDAEVSKVVEILHGAMEHHAGSSPASKGRKRTSHR